MSLETCENLDEKAKKHKKDSASFPDLGGIICFCFFLFFLVVFVLYRFRPVCKSFCDCAGVVHLQARVQ